MKYKFLPHTADVMFEAEGETLEEVFEACGRATFDVMADVKTVESKVKFQVDLENKDSEKLLFEFLSEIIYLKDAEYSVFSDVSIYIEGKYKLKATLSGDKIKPKKQKLGNDVKAVTMHKFKLEKTKNGFKAVVILDI